MPADVRRTITSSSVPSTAVGRPVDEVEVAQREVERADREAAERRVGRPDADAIGVEAEQVGRRVAGDGDDVSSDWRPAACDARRERARGDRRQAEDARTRAIAAAPSSSVNRQPRTLSAPR